MKSNLHQIGNDKFIVVSKCSNSKGDKYDIDRFKKMNRYKSNTCIKDTTKKCVICKQEYNPKRLKQKLCSKECADIFHKTDELQETKMDKFFKKIENKITNKQH